MEVKPWDVLLVSAFGRGDWLAVELKSQGLSVCLIDVSESLGHWPAEDIEGPFGFFMREDYPQSFIEYISQLGNFRNLGSGFTVWTKDGPLEMKSSITGYRMAQLGLHPGLRDLLAGPKSLSAHEKSELNQCPFSQIWPLCLAFQVDATTYKPNRQALQGATSMPLMNSFSVNLATRSGRERSLKWVESQGVPVILNSEILDIAMSGRRQLTGVELKGEKSGFFKFEQLVWNLSSEESYFFNERLGKKLFPQGVIEPHWDWMRFRIKVQECLEVHTLLSHLCLIDDVMEPWTHENLCLLQKTGSTENIDAWVRAPTVQRFNKDYLKNLGRRLEEKLRGKMPMSEATVVDYPQAFTYTYKELGPPRFPIYLKEDESSRSASFFNNFSRDGQEVWERFSLDYQFQFQSKLRDQLVRQWKQRQIRNKKELSGD
jgi:hypothetical protein